MERDPVCGMNVEPAKAAATRRLVGKTYYFCARGCAERFDRAAIAGPARGGGSSGLALFPARDIPAIVIA